MIIQITCPHIGTWTGSSQHHTRLFFLLQVQPWAQLALEKIQFWCDWLQHNLTPFLRFNSFYWNCLTFNSHFVLAGMRLFQSWWAVSHSGQKRFWGEMWCRTVELHRTKECFAEMVSEAELLSVNDSWRNLFLLIGSGQMPGYSDKELTGTQPCSNPFSSSKAAEKISSHI